MANQIPAIPTKYGGTQFRSRLEARWAAFFDLLGWSWEYEPLDLAGYIPDFVIGFSKPMIVEVKPYIGSPWSWMEDGHEGSLTLDKIAQSGWTGSGLLVGATLFTDKDAAGWVPSPGFVRKRATNLGLVFQPDYREELGGQVGDVEWARAGIYANPFGLKACCGGPVDVVGWFTCLRCGHHDKGPTLRSSADVIAQWREAGNRSQWRAPEAG
jgi:hypothetical protein